MKKSMNFSVRFLAVLFIVAIAASSCMNNKKSGSGTAASSAKIDTSGLVRVDTSIFSIGIPKGWTHHVGSAMGTFTAYYIMAPRVNNFSPNMNILTQNVGSTTMDDYVKLNMTQMKAMNVTINSTGGINIGDMPGKYFKSTFVMQGRTIVIKSYFCIHNQTAYVLTGTTLPADTNKYYPIFDSMAASFKIK